MSTTFSPGSSRLLQLGVAGSSSRLRSSSSKKPPEPLRRAVADCLSSSSPPATSHHGAIPSMPPSEALRNIRVCVHTHPSLALLIIWGKLILLIDVQREGLSILGICFSVPLINEFCVG
ncbi:hypothetical protein Bca52824_018704 [Brassica carinata]|uniref:Uncharacterized protein n=1 Tax=Brassica carinata TaxID=52824 RepID=A0A8X8AZQ0_BRACI|nr:hypothetical protein Bca52824_018704 [Brassica carinata]